MMLSNVLFLIAGILLDRIWQALAIRQFVHNGERVELTLERRAMLLAESARTEGRQN